MIAEGKDKLEWYRQVDPAKLNTLKELIASPNYKVGTVIFFLFLQTKPCFCRLFAWSQLDISAIPVSISAISLRRLTTYKLLDFKVAKWAVSSLTLCSNPF
jgi:hypothetical protein